MGNLVVTYPDGRRETYAYEQLLDLDPYSCFYQNPPWNQPGFRRFRDLRDGKTGNSI